jgi:hypothetical protein
MDMKVREKIGELELRLSSVERPLTGSRVLAESTRRHYLCYLNQLTTFLGYVPDWESLIILRPDFPPFCPSMNCDSLIAFIDFKAQEAGTLVFNISSGHRY